jgi:GTPase SAR1 family protein
MGGAKSKPSSGNELPIVMLGKGGVGKSALTIRFIEDKFLDAYNPT